MSEVRENRHIPKLQEQFAEGKINRREFLRYSTLLGMSATAAYAFVGKVTGQNFAAPAQAEEIPKGGTMRRWRADRSPTPACAGRPPGTPRNGPGPRR